MWPAAAEDDLGVGAPGDRRDRALGRVEGVVGVGVDEPGEQRPAAAVDDGRRRSLGDRRRDGSVWGDGGDAFADDDDIHRVTSLGRHAIDEPDVLEDRAHRVIVTAPRGRPP